MVDSISFSQVNFKGSTNLLEQFKTKNQIASNPNNQNTTQPPTISGAEAVANYNKVLVTPSATQTVNSAIPNKIDTQKDAAGEAVLDKVKDLIPTEPKKFDQDFIANFKGEKVLDSDGNVAYYEEKDGDISKIYIAYDGKVSQALEIDNKTGNKIRKDYFDAITGNPLYIDEFDPATGMIKKYTIFNSDKNSVRSVAEYSEKGEFSRSKIFDDKTGKVEKVVTVEQGCDGGCETRYEFVNGKLSNRVTENRDGVPIEASRFVFGEEVGIVSNKQYPVVNTSEFDISKIDMKAPELGNVELDIIKVNGEMKMRSNNTLEKIIVKDGNIERTYKMDYTGKKLDEIVDKENGINKRIIKMNETTGNVECISECNSEGDIVKDTGFDKNGNLAYISDTPASTKEGVLRHVFFYEDGKIRAYDLEDAKDYNLKATFRFDKGGNLVGLNRYDEKGELVDKYYNNMINFVPNETQDPKNAEKVQALKSRLTDAGWVKTYIPGANIVHIKQNGVIDGMEYEVFSNGTVREINNWGRDAIIMNSNEEMVIFFVDTKKATPQQK